MYVSHLRDPNPMTAAFVQAAVATGIRSNDDVNGRDPEGVGYAQVTQRKGRRWSAADAYLKPARRRSNLDLVTGAHVTRLLLEGRHAVGVEFVHRRMRRSERASTEVILAGGAINSPQLLLLSGIGPADQLGRLGIAVAHDLPGVGRNLQDHPMCVVIASTEQPISLVSAEAPGQLLRFFLRRKGMLTSNIGEAWAFVRSAAHLTAPDIELIFAPVPFIDHGLVAPPGHGLSIGAVLLQPTSRGSVTLASADPIVAPSIRANYLSDADGDDLRRLLHAVRLARTVMRTPPLAGYAAQDIEPVPGTPDADLEAFVRAQTETIYHPVGTCRMGTGGSAVVDAELRVHGITGLRVVDASVMPTIVRGHPQAATTMIAERAADLIRSNPTASDSKLSTPAR